MSDLAITSNPAKETATTVTLEWTPPPGAAGYVFVMNDGRRSSTLDPTRSSLKVAKTNLPVKITALRTLIEGVYPPVAPPPPPSSGRPFAPDAIWNTPIPASPALRPNSAALITYMMGDWPNPNMGLRGWGFPIYEAKPGDPTYTVKVTLYQGNLNSQGPVPIPDGATPDPESDGHLIVIDRARGLTWDMWTAKKTSAGWECGGGSVSSLTGPGLLQPGQAGSVAASFPALAGVIRVDELAAGVIPHALTFNMPGVNKTGHVWPAMNNDGSSTDPNSPMEGMRFQLDPTINVDGLPISSWEKPVAKALQVYGMFLRDSAGSMSIAAETSSRWSTVAGMPSSEVAFFSTGFPWQRLRAVS